MVGEEEIDLSEDESVELSRDTKSEGRLSGQLADPVVYREGALEGSEILKDQDGKLYRR